MFEEIFEGLTSTKLGRVTEHICSKWLFKREWSIKANTCTGYNPEKDFIASKGDVSTSIEVKGDNYPKGNNIALEYLQTNCKGQFSPSGMATTKAEYIFYYVFRTNTLYIFKKSTYDDFLKRGLINVWDIRLCNRDSETGPTECYVVDIDMLKSNNFFCQIHENVLSPLDKEEVLGMLKGLGV